MTRGRVVLRESDPFYRTLIEGLLAAVGVSVAADADVLVAPGSPEDSGRFRAFIPLERQFSPERLLSAVEAVL
jgi:hypothetical protein